MLDRILSGIESRPNPRVLVGFENADDAGVYLLDENTALIHTVDFFTPIVDDPFVFGQIAAANALSDVYAMGGTPITALSILAVSTEVIPEGGGVLFRNQDPADLSRTLISVLMEPGKLSQWGIRLNQKVVSEYSLDKMLESLDGLYREFQSV